MLRKVISGGQTGADIAGLRAAKAVGIRTGGYAPRGYLTEKGPRPTLLRDVYDLEEHSSPKYPPRTLANILCSDMTYIIADKLDSGSGLTANLCYKHKKPFFHIEIYDLTSERKFLEIFNFTYFHSPRILNVAGNRESKHPGIEALAIPFLKALFRSLNTPAFNPKGKHR